MGGRPRKLLTGGRVALARQLVEDPNHSIDDSCSTLGISRSATCNTLESAAERPEGRQKELLDRFKGWHPVVSTLLNATEASTILRNAISDLQPLTSWSKRRVTLLGDAAHA
ncbi:MAG: hypothetical protein J2P37_35000, partial [Ktedonobacteraceae bacterium]|nr:hypothetical protein [Ktedonobacteraceae bacterium]